MGVEPISPPLDNISVIEGVEPSAVIIWPTVRLLILLTVHRRVELLLGD
jgi:hypothetical protein